MSNSLHGQTVVVVGASSGIGQATACMAARAGATVIAVARREERLQVMQQSLAEDGIHMGIRKADASNLEQMQSVVSGVLESYKRIDIAVYACGTNSPARSMEVMLPATWNEILETNLTGAFYVAHAVLPAMRAARAGHLIFISSTAGTIPDLSGAAYQASKRGLLGLAHAIRLEERERGIRTCCIMPGLTNTELVEKRPQKLLAETLRNALQPNDVASTIVHVMQMPARVTMPEILMVPSLA